MAGFQRLEMSVALEAAKTVALILFYYSFSISLTFYNKWILTVRARTHAHSYMYFIM